MRWLGTFLHLVYPPSQDATAQAFAALLDERREHMATIEASRQHLERIAADPVDAALHSIIEDL